MNEQELSAMLERGMTLEQIAETVDRHPSTVSYWMAKYGLVAVHAEKHRPRGGIDRDELQRLIDQGMSITEIAEACDRSKATVRHWMRRYGLTTIRAVLHTNRRRAVVLAMASSGGDLPGRLVMQCQRHGEVTFVREGRGSYRCDRCRIESVADHRRRLKELIVAEAGGRCALCSYDRSLRALQFHHVDRDTKEFSLSQRGVTRSLEALRAEAAKCVLLCGNCHAEVEAGEITLPVQ